MNVGPSTHQEPCCICQVFALTNFKHVLVLCCWCQLIFYSFQEEYVEDDDLGILDCGHDFHTVCIKQWLMQKNLCPICKSTALMTWGWVQHPTLKKVCAGRIITWFFTLDYRIYESWRMFDFLSLHNCQISVGSNWTRVEIRPPYYWIITARMVEKLLKRVTMIWNHQCSRVAHVKLHDRWPLFEVNWMLWIA